MNARREVTERHMAAATSEARGEELRDADSVVEWLSGECSRVSVLPIMPLLRDKTASDFKDFSSAALVALLFDAGQPANTTRAVRDALSDRYCERPTVAARINERAGELALQLAEDERDAHREAA